MTESAIDMLNLTAFRKPLVIVVAKGWLGDTLACTAAATSLASAGLVVQFYHRWPQLDALFAHERRFEVNKYPPRLLRLYKAIWGMRKNVTVIEEPIPWSYKEPFTAEIRRIAGCDVSTEFQLPRPDDKASLDTQRQLGSKPQLCISRDIKKRSYGRNIDQLVIALSEFNEINWIGLDSSLDSKRGVRCDMEKDIQTLLAADAYLGPEGGMLWLAAGLGVKTIYLTEHIHALEKKFGPGVHQALGMVKVFPRGGHTALPPGCPNSEIVARVQEVVSSTRALANDR
jgi:hypothetical protein